MSGRQPRQVQRKLGEADADGNWQLGSPAPESRQDPGCREDDDGSDSRTAARRRLSRRE
jgi:hypothetical protein